MDTALDLGLGPLIAALVLFPLGSAALLYWVTQRGALAARLREYDGVVAPYFVSVGIVFAMFAAFLGADIWARAKENDHSLERELAAIQSINQIAGAFGEAGAPIGAATRRYAQATMDEELSRRHPTGGSAADRALAELVKAILGLPAAAGTAQGAMLAGYGKIWDARALRRHIARQHSDPHKWLIVLILGFLTQVALTLVHLNNPKARAAALTVFTVAYIATLVALAVHEHPELAHGSLDRFHRIAIGDASG